MTNISLPELPLPVLANNQTHQCWFTAEQMMDFAKDAVRIYRLTSTNNTSKQAAGEAVGYANRNEFEMEGCAGFTCSKRPPLTEASFFTIPLYLHPPRHPADEVRSAVTDAMVDRACDAYDAVAFELANRTAIRAAMTAALAGTP